MGRSGSFVTARPVVARETWRFRGRMVNGPRLRFPPRPADTCRYGEDPRARPCLGPAVEERRPTGTSQRPTQAARMNHRDRLKQLHALADRLSRLPASPDRDRMLAEVRIRTVDVETGVAPGPMRPPEPDAGISATGAGPAKVSGTKQRRATHPRPEPPAKMPRVEPHRRSAPRPSVATIAPAVKVTTPPAGGEALEPTPRPGSIRPLDLLEGGGVLCLGDLPAESPASGAPVASPPWAGGLRG
jgi:hypothetical protein